MPHPFVNEAANSSHLLNLMGMFALSCYSCYMLCESETETEQIEAPNDEQHLVLKEATVQSL